MCSKNTLFTYISAATVSLVVVTFLFADTNPSSGSKNTNPIALDRRHDLEASDPLNISIVPDRRYDLKDSDETSVYLDDDIYLVLHNRGENPIKIWLEWCSWGYYSVTIDFVDASGKTYKLKREPRAWTRNFPDPFLIPPGGYYVWPVNLSDGDWEGVPWSRIKNHDKCSMQASFSIPESADAKSNGVWSGSCLSKTLAFKAYTREKRNEK